MLPGLEGDRGARRHANARVLTAPPAPGPPRPAPIHNARALQRNNETVRRPHLPTSKTINLDRQLQCVQSNVLFFLPPPTVFGLCSNSVGCNWFLQRHFHVSINRLYHSHDRELSSP